MLRVYPYIWYQRCWQKRLAYVDGSLPRGWISAEQHSSYSLFDGRKSNNVIALMASNVDDLIYRNEPEAEHVIKKILAHFQVG